MNFYDYDSNTPEYKFYEDLYLEVSVSNKAKCRSCGKTIDKDVLRWCSSERDRAEPIYVSKRYYHQKCLPPVAGHPIVDYNPKTQTGKLKNMNVNPSKQTEKDLFNNAVDEYVKYRNNYDKKSKKQDKNWDPDNSDSDSGEEVVKKAKKATKVNKSEKKTNKRSKADDSDEDIDAEVSLAGYTDGQRQKYLKKLEELKSKTVAQLKAILKANNQTQTGTKEVLLEKVADGYTLGAIPQCTKCGGGKLRFNKSTGEYTCPGFMEDTDKVDCDAVFSIDQVVRFDWVEP
ncbi:poly polymerase and DNA-ligase Zn-finger region family protein, putative (macronuclear) [Tetrahymena thermophila SB210]|uniref:NAD(+) ADP-ribosyltransferase n=1 Tax=Tetrahymena thermophila (strain SB210) TaxID=312017 RepID=I7MIX3_TETTS|nr:poly polymerase and DNA-ligase Zn-finger region family protein, putative [Tetrahymena thermophila SB210]EAS04828.1 poly polymerase and DNA-ligase Zn-finger region family protein, putative [Tetrahymena thermophila SB210]|eukprot:XP_001025073.1 poly polymerase and DNA-ligase Zn-finger region family protein, putative [Tetrahymena thermophila SB210]